MTSLRQKGFVFGIAVGIATAAGIASAAEVAKVNGQSITDKEVHAALSGVNEGQREQILKDGNSKRQIINSIVDQEVLVGEAVKEKLDQDQEFKDAMSAFRKQLLSSRVLQKNLQPKLTEQTAKKYYESNKSRYSTDQVHVMHILVADEEKAREVMKQVKAPNADFQEIAEKVSKDPSAKNNRGDLGFVGRDRLVPEFTEAAFAAGDGDIVGPVKTSYGYHVIKVVKKKLGKPLQYDEVELRVKNDLREELTRNYLGNLRKTAKIQINDQVIDKM